MKRCQKSSTWLFQCGCRAIVPSHKFIFIGISYHFDFILQDGMIVTVENASVEHFFVDETTSAIISCATCHSKISLLLLAFAKKNTQHHH